MRVSSSLMVKHQAHLSMPKFDKQTLEQVKKMQTIIRDDFNYIQQKVEENFSDSSSDFAEELFRDVDVLSDSDEDMYFNEIDKKTET